MQTDLIHREGNDCLLIFFTGWGTTPEVAVHLQLPERCDYLTAYDYRTVLPQELPTLDTYREVYVAGWSMGVWALDILAEHLPVPTKAVAINGTPLPMHDRYGIPNDIFRGTLEGLDDANRERFNRRMCGGKKLLAVFNSFSARSTEELREELYGTYLRVKDLSDDTLPKLAWSEAIVATKDLIVPTVNQLAYWEQHHTPVRLLDGVGHYPLMEYQNWSEIFQL
ncbi:MAG: DUF452 family protein [Bacteroidales bacterium]|uniref:DUF452 family protein n=1 Tax=Porphyromonas sp. TaxID=1924944 RepID=UPI002979C4FC|nr:pimeloyl-ACP methyl esterase BioG family protein [Porphyromonas sp.]MDD7437770.1 DUF452 family protein [Bacteroidales bacterium]MDY3067277.1 DUF452 family protein [Porphyromonas sp.]